jgi:hypothetical protein
MKKRIMVLTGTFILLSVLTQAQDKFFTKNGKISFVSKGNIETIAAKHKGITCVLDAKSRRCAVCGIDERDLSLKKH